MNDEGSMGGDVGEEEGETGDVRIGTFGAGFVHFCRRNGLDFHCV
jgi:hypothetical protein